MVHSLKCQPQVCGGVFTHVHTYTHKRSVHFTCLSLKGCEGESNLSMWIYVLLGNVLRGIGETPVQPLGISYIDDFATEENAALYVGKENNAW